LPLKERTEKKIIIISLIVIGHKSNSMPWLVSEKNGCHACFMKKTQTEMPEKK